jgi:hypothetical protein
MKFDPIGKRAIFLRPETERLRFVLESNYDADNPRGNAGGYLLADAIKLWILGLYEEAGSIAARAAEWLEYAVETNEEFGDSQRFHRATLTADLALATWMRDGKNYPKAWRLALEAELEALADKEIYPDDESKSGGVDSLMAHYFQAEEYEKGIIEFEKRFGVREIVLKKTLSPRAFAYALCLHKVRKQFDLEELFQAGRRMLISRVEKTWLCQGEYKLPAMWLKIVYWHRDPSLSQLQTIWKAYDVMPDVKRPEWIV